MDGQAIVGSVVSGLITAALIAVVTFMFRKRIVASFFHFHDRRLRLAGVASITRNWNDLVRFTGPDGRWLQSKYRKSRASTWYFITQNPHGFYQWLGRISEEDSILSRVKSHDLDIVWVFQDRSTQGRERQLLRGYSIDEPKSTYQRGVEALLAAKDAQPDKWRLFTSNVSHFYMAFLSVPRQVGSVDDRHAPPGTFGFVMPYLMAPDSYTARYALCLEAPQDHTKGAYVLDYYYNSVRDFVKVGKDLGWLTEDTGSPAKTTQS